MSSVRMILLCCTCMMLSTNLAAADREVVLVAASTSPLHNLDSLELRKIYLGFIVKRDKKTVKGLRYTEDEHLNNIFLQTVVAMSEKSYRRRLLFLPLRQGIPRPHEYNEFENLLKALSKNPYSVTYMWKVDAARSSKVKILRVLWQQN
jgi:exonuclease I